MGKLTVGDITLARKDWTKVTNACCCCNIFLVNTEWVQFGQDLGSVMVVPLSTYKHLYMIYKWYNNDECCSCSHESTNIRTGNRYKTQSVSEVRTNVNMDI